jgi:hypothetical protein
MIPRFAVLVTCALGMGGFVAAPAQAAPTITLPKVTGITTTGATISATINTGGVASDYAFLYGETTDYELGATPTGFIPAGSGTVTVSEVLTDLTPGTTYHYQLELELNPLAAYYQLAPVFSSDATFKTLPTGKLTLTSTKIPVTKGKAAISLKCASVLACKGKVYVTMHSKGKTLICVSSKISIKAGKKATVSQKVAGQCLALIASTKNLQRDALFNTKLTSVQPDFSKKVTLVLSKGSGPAHGGG